MGKSKKKKKFSACKPSPTGLPSVKDLEADSEENGETSQTASWKHGSEENIITQMIEKLQSPLSEERECGCATIAGLVSQEKTIPLLMKYNIIKILAPLMVDQNPHVKNSATGALRNLSIDGGYDTCVKMIDNDVMTPLVALIKQYGVKWSVESECNKKQKELKHEIFNQATQLLWNLCESSNVALNIFNREDLIMYILPCLQYEVYGFTVALSAAQCINAVTEDNTSIVEYCRSEEPLSLLMSLCTSSVNSTEHALLRTLVSGALVNIFGKELLTASGNLVSGIVSSLSDVLSVEAVSMFKAAIDEITQELSSTASNACGDTEAIPENGFQAKLENKLSEVDNIVNAQLVALQIAANLCCPDDEEWEEIESSGSFSSDEIVMDEEMEAESGDSNFSPLCVPTELHSAFVQNDVISKVLTKILFPILPSEHRIEKYSYVRRLTKQFTQIQIHALLCINNMVSAVEIENIWGLEKLHAVWDGLVQSATNQQAVQNLELLEAITGAMRAVIQKLAELKSPKFMEVSSNDLHFIYEMATHCSSNEIKVNAIRIVCTIGCLLTKYPSLNPLLKDIGAFLTEISCTASDLWVISEALDSLFDVFGEDHLDPVVQEIKMVEKLRNLLPMLKSKIASKKRTLGEHYAVVVTARTNLIRFLKYKSKQ